MKEKKEYQEKEVLLFFKKRDTSKPCRSHKKYTKCESNKTFADMHKRMFSMTRSLKEYFFFHSPCVPSIVQATRGIQEESLSSGKLDLVGVKQTEHYNSAF